MWSPNLSRRAICMGLAILVSQAAIGCGSDSSDERLIEVTPESRAAIARYRSFLKENSSLLVRAAQAMLPEIEDGAVTRAQSRYARARVRYAQVEPFASRFAELDASIDGHVDEASKGGFRGFHRIEQALWVKGTTEGMSPIGRRLIEDTKELESRFEAARLRPTQIVDGAASVLAEISTATLAGRDERYAHIDLVDLAGNVEGIEAAFDAVKPLDPIEDDLLSEVDLDLRQLYTAIGEYGIRASAPNQQRARSPGVSFILFDSLSPSEIRAIDRKVTPLTQLFSEIQARLSGS